MKDLILPLAFLTLVSAKSPLRQGDRILSPSSKRNGSFHLPEYIRPTSYDIFLKPNIEDGTFSGSVTIEGIVAAYNLKRIVVHSKELTIDHEKVTVENNSMTHYEFDLEKDFYIINLENNLNETFKVQIPFKGNLSNKTKGLFKSIYKDEGKDKVVVATQFEPIDARKAFPCFDEPGMKARFTLTLARKKDMITLSNMPKVKTDQQFEDDTSYVLDVYEKTPTMSTYLLAFMVGDVARTVPQDPDKMPCVDIAVYTRHEVKDKANYSASISKTMIQWYENRFGFDYPLQKVDSLALPPYSGGMENWGLITYGETSLLYDKASSSAEDKENIEQIVAHELAHQWFGNLVTMDWWSDLWLNEGFATFMSFYGANSVRIDKTHSEIKPAKLLQDILAEDSLPTSHPIYNEIEVPSQHGSFTKITYYKGALIIRMLAHILGEEVFFNGISSYLKAKQYGSATHDDLWKYLTDSQGDSLTKVHVKTIMDPWIFQKGYPLVTLKKEANGNYSVSQHHFDSLSHTSQTTLTWHIPLNFASTKDEFCNTQPTEWLKPGRPDLEVDLGNHDLPVIANVKRTGFYRVNYDEGNWNLIIQKLLSDHTYFHVLNRAALLDDSFALAKAGLINYQTSIDILSYLKNEDEYLPWYIALISSSYVQNMIKNSDRYDAWKEMMILWMEPHYKQLIDTKCNVDDNYLNCKLMNLIATNLCYIGYQDCEKEAIKKFSEWQKGKMNLLSPESKEWVFCTAIRLGCAENYNFLKTKLLKSHEPKEKQAYLAGMACSTQQTQIEGLFEMVLSESLPEEMALKAKYLAKIMEKVCINPSVNQFVWEWYKKNFKKFSEIFGQDSHQIMGILVKNFNTKEQLDDVKNFMINHELMENKTLKMVADNIDWMNKQYKEVSDWLDKSKPSNNKGNHEGPSKFMNLLLIVVLNYFGKWLIT